MPKKRITDADTLKAACAYLITTKASQAEIADTLDISQATVSRFLSETEGKFWESKAIFFRERVSEEIMAKVESLIFPAGKILEKLESLARHTPGMIVPTLRVFPTGGGGESRSGLDGRLRHFSNQAAPAIRDILLRSRLCGVCWGVTLSGVVAALKNLSFPSQKGIGEKQVIPLCGEPLGELPTSFSSSTLAAEIQLLLSGNRETFYSLSPVPAFIPKDFSAGEMDAIWKLIGHVKSYHDIFAGGAASSPLAERLDTIITSVGDSRHPVSYGKDSILEKSGWRNVEDIEAIIFGDIAGTWIPRPNISPQHKRVLKKLTEHWTGVREEHLAGCARRAAENRAGQNTPAGVVVATFGKNKAECVLAALKRGLVNVLLCDVDLERQLEELLEKEIAAIARNQMSNREIKRV
jgi:predicted XRE-type DNA-binding protein